jgi:segregation and condensation protein B
MKKTREELEAELGKLLVLGAEATTGAENPPAVMPAENETISSAGNDSTPAAQAAEAPAHLEAPSSQDAPQAAPPVQDEEVAAGFAQPDAQASQADMAEAAENARQEDDEILPALAEKLPPALEALLFTLAEPVTQQQLLSTLRKVHPRLNGRTLRQALEALRDQLQNARRGLRLEEVAGGWQLRTAPDFLPYLRHLSQVRPPRMSRATLETLAVVAYRQPVTRGEIENIRGVDCGAVLRGLLEKKMVRILGRKDEPGRPLIYGTTKEFLSFFSLRDLASLPTLKDFAELSDEARQQLGVGQPASLEEEKRAEEEPPQPLDEELQAAYTPVGKDEIIQELDQALDEIRKRDLHLRREVLPPPAPAPAPAVETPAPPPAGGDAAPPEADTSGERE